MQIEIITAKISFHLHGFGGVAVNQDYSGTAFKLSGRMWEVVKAHGIRNKGKNIWVYEPGNRVFAGVEIENDQDAGSLEQKTITLNKYAYFKHVGPYRLIKESGQSMRDELEQNGHKTIFPYVEIYGHWTGNENTSETELFMSLE
ncbi:MAG TPA: hypothetical protein PLX35_05075 [Cyclobacteriaceae bacterium]|nr:hypothetical protein [Cyclobacteriaceae bacterium]